MTAFHASGGGVKYAWRKLYSLIAFSLAVFKFSSLAEFTCWLGKAEQLPLLWGGRSCVSIANNRFGEGVHPVREIHSHSERSEESSQIPLDCFTTFAMTVIHHPERSERNELFNPSTFQLFNQSYQLESEV